MNTFAKIHKKARNKTRIAALLLLRIAFLLCLEHTTHPHAAQAQSFRVGGGVSAAFENIVAVRFPLPQGASYLYSVQQSQNLAVNAGARYMLSFERGVGMTFSAGIHHAETPIFSLLDPSQPSLPTSVKVVNSIVPVGIGFEYRFISLLVLHCYIAADATYNAILTRQEYSQPSGLQVASALAHRIGGNVAFGVDVIIFGLGADISLRYNWANVLLRDPNELSKNFLSLHAALVLGEK
jgi:hypothetical protein